jgi:hypothetical protein
MKEDGVKYENEGIIEEVRKGKESSKEGARKYE